MAERVAIIDNGGANIASLLYAFKRLQVTAILTAEAETIKSAERVVLPGVGAAKDAMRRLHEYRLTDVIRKLTQPVLGICLGMQLLADASEEEDVECLGIIPGTASKLVAGTGTPVPNMGWCPVETRGTHGVFSDLNSGSYFYFLHSYALPVCKYTLAQATHAGPFAAVTARDNFLAAQFHPERSSIAGAQFLRNFLGVCR